MVKISGKGYKNGGGGFTGRVTVIYIMNDWIYQNVVCKKCKFLCENPFSNFHLEVIFYQDNLTRKFTKYVKKMHEFDNP